MNTRPLTEEEIRQILASVSNKLGASSMNVSNVQGRVISIVKDSESKQSGGIFMSKGDTDSTSYMGEFYNLEDFLKALNEFVGSVKKEQTSTFTKKGKVEVDKKVVDEAVHEFTSLIIRKKETKNNNADFYTVSRSNENSDIEKRSGGLITSQGKEVKEGKYIDEAAARQILSSIEIPEEEKVAVIPPIENKKEEKKEKKKEETIIVPGPVSFRVTVDYKTPNMEVPTKKEVEEAVESIGKKTPKRSTFKVNKLHPSIKEKTKEYAKKLAPLLLIPILLIHQTKLMGKKYPHKGPLPPRVNIEQTEDIPDIPIPDDKLPAKEMPKEEADHSLKIGDVVMMEKGIKYDHNSQADDKISGVIGENPYREEGEYTVDVIAILDAETNAIIGYTGKAGGSLDKLLEEHNLRMQDVESGKVRVRYNVSEGINKDLGRAEAAGWVTYKSDTYEKIGNVQNMITLDAVVEKIDDSIKEGRSL